jgi:hypothetical protein
MRRLSSTHPFLESFAAAQGKQAMDGPENQFFAALPGFCLSFALDTEVRLRARLAALLHTQLQPG